MEAPWQGECGTGKGADTLTAGFEGAWTDHPLQWDNQYFQDLLDKQWEVFIGPGGHHQWRISGSDSKLMRLTSDISLLHDAEYLKYVKKFATNMSAFNAAFDAAWFDLTTTYGSGTWADNAKCDNGPFPDSLRHVEDFRMMNTDVEALQAPSQTQVSSSFNKISFIAGAGFTALMFAIVMRLKKDRDRDLNARLLTNA